MRHKKEFIITKSSPSFYLLGFTESKQAIRFDPVSQPAGRRDHFPHIITEEFMYFYSKFQRLTRFLIYIYFTLGPRSTCI